MSIHSTDEPRRPADHGIRYYKDGRWERRAEMNTDSICEPSSRLVAAALSDMISR